MRKSIATGLTLLLATGLGGVALASSSTASVDGSAATSPAPQVERGLRQLRENPQVVTNSADGAAIRIGGADRYITSTLISEQAWTPEIAGVVFLATGENFPDALSLSGSFAGVGPILLTRPNELPEAVHEEIARLKPCVVVAVGSEASVSQAVMDQAGALADPMQWKCNA